LRETLMKIRYQSKNRLWFEWDASTTKEVFEHLAKLQEIFDISHCGCCQSTDIRFVMRENEGFQFYELRCNECHAKLEFGQRREGGELFPKRKDENNNWRDNGGWYKYQANANGGSSKASSGTGEEPF